MNDRNERQRRRTTQSATIRDVAALAGVSPMTVSRVINRETTVKSETKALVDAAIRDLNYAPNPAARSLAGSAPFRIGLLYDNPSTGYLSEFLVGALDESSRTGAQVVIEKCAEPELAGGELQRHACEGDARPRPGQPRPEQGIDPRLVIGRDHRFARAPRSWPR